MALPITFYTFPLAYFPGRVALVLAEKAIAHKAVNMDVIGGGSLSPEFMRINPNSTVPVLQHGEKVMTESTVIVQYLDTLDGSAPLGGSEVDRDFVNQFVKQVDQWDGNLYAASRLPANVLGTMEGLTNYRIKVATARAKENPELQAAYEAKIASMQKTGNDAKVPEKVSACMAELNNILDTAETKLTQSQQFLAGPAYTIADALLGPILHRVTSMCQHKELIAARPALREYMRRVRERPSWKAAFGGDSAYGKFVWFGVPLLKIKICGLFGRY